MLMLVALAIAVALVPVLGGRLGRLADLRVRRTWAIGLALGLQLVITLVVPDAPAGVLSVVHLVSYAAAAVFVLSNVNVPGLAILALGAGANVAAIAANGGVMPARRGALEAAGIAVEQSEFVNSGAVDGARLWWLGDVFAVPEPFPLANVFSVGDVVIVIGAVVTIHAVCGSRLLPARWRTSSARVRSA